MPDPYVPLPEDDESVDALLDDAKDYLAANVPGWAPSDGALEVAILAAVADEASTLYALLRERATDEFRDFGTDVLGVPAGEPVPASATTTWVARDTAGHTIDAGQTIVIDGPAGRFAFEVLQAITIAPGATTATDVVVQALEPGSAPNGATGAVLFDDQPAWVDDVTVTTLAAGGSDGQDDDQHLAAIRRTAQQLSRAPIVPRDWELLAQEVDEVARALVRDGYDNTSGLSNQGRTVSIYPVTIDGQPISAGGKAAIAALAAARREVNWVVRIADPTYTTINVVITVGAEEGADHADVAARVQTAIADQALNPGVFGQPALGERRTWRRRTVVRLYEVASVADDVEGVSYVETVTLNGGTSNITLTGAAPLPQPGTITVTVNDPT